MVKRGRPKDSDVQKAEDLRIARRMFEMRLQGISVHMIARTLKCAPSTVHTMMQRYTRQELLPYVEEYRELQKGRLDYLWHKLVESGRLEKGDPAAYNAGVNILRRYAETVGSDAPTKIELGLHVDPREIELHSLILEAQRQAKADIKAIRAGQPDAEGDDDIEEAEVVDEGDA